MFTLGQTVEMWFNADNRLCEPFTLGAIKKQVTILGFDRNPSQPEGTPLHLRKILIEALNPADRHWNISAAEIEAWKRNNEIDSVHYKFEFIDDIASYYGKGVIWAVPNWVYQEGMFLDINLFIRHGQDLIRRYFPRPNSRDLAAAVLQTIDCDTAATPRDKEMLRALVGTTPAAPGVNYNWCAQCTAFVGWREHGHCTVCHCPHDVATMCSRCSNCRSGCDCGNCSQCQRYIRTNRRADYCPHCARCVTCCSCVICENADGRIVECRSCHYCNRCCNCNGMSENAGKPWEADTIKHRQLFNSKRLVGVEWEYNNSRCNYNDYEPNNPIRRWSAKWRGGIHGDGSCGLEVVTPPIAGDHIVNCLTDLGKAFIESKAQIDRRCGLHVHVDARDLTWEDMYKLLKVYAHVEPALYLLAGQQRLENNYCAPAGADYMFALSQMDKKEAVIAVACGQIKNKGRTHQSYNGRKTMRGRVDKKGGSRYRGLNIMPWLAGRAKKAKDTTVEFRLHQNAQTSEQVIAWAKLCSRLIDFAIKSSDDDITKLNKSAMRALCEIAPECKEYIVKAMRVWRKENKRSQRLIKFNGGKYLAPRFGCVNQ